MLVSLLYVRFRAYPKAMVWKTVVSMKNTNDIRNQTCNLPASSTMHQKTPPHLFLTYKYIMLPKSFLQSRVTNHTFWLSNTNFSHSSHYSHLMHVLGITSCLESLANQCQNKALMLCIPFNLFHTTPQSQYSTSLSNPANKCIFTCVIVNIVHIYI